MQDHHQSSFSLVEPQGNIHPQFHTFNYVEQYDSTKQPSAPGFAQPDFHEYNNIVARDVSSHAKNVRYYFIITSNFLFLLRVIYYF